MNRSRPAFALMVVTALAGVGGGRAWSQAAQADTGVLGEVIRTNYVNLQGTTDAPLTIRMTLTYRN